MNGISSSHYNSFWGLSMHKGERSSEFYETFFELEEVRGEEKGAFWEQNISLALFYNTKAISETS